MNFTDLTIIIIVIVSDTYANQQYVGTDHLK